MLQQAIDEKIYDEKIPRGVLTIQNESGSATLPEGIRLILIGCQNVNITAEGYNECSFRECDNVSVDVKNGVVRFDKTSNIGTVTAEECKVNVEGADIRTMDLTNCEANIINCTIATLTALSPDLHAIKCTISTIEVEGGLAHLEESTVESLSATNHCQIDGIESTFKSITGGGNLTLSNCTTEEVSGEDCNCTITRGSHESIDLIGNGSSVLDNLDVETLSIEDGQAVLSNIQVSESLDLDNGMISGVNVVCSGEFTCNESKVILVDSSVEKEASLTGTACRLVSCSFAKSLSISGGAIESDNTTVEKEFSASGCCVQSFNDSWESGDLTELTGPSTIRKATVAKNLSVSGDNSGSILLDEVQVTKNLEISDFSVVRAVNVTATKKLIIDNAANVVLSGITSLRVDIENTGLATIGGDNEITKLSVSDTIHAVTQGLTSITASDSTVTDQGSTFLLATDTTILGQGSNVVAAENCIGIMSGGVFVGDSSVVLLNGGVATLSQGSVAITNGGEVVNPLGLTVGCDFNPFGSGGAVCYDGNLILQATVGNVMVNSIAGNILLDSALAIIGTAGGMVDILAGGSMNLAAIGQMGLEASDIAENAAGTIIQQASVIIQI